jgi:calcineurin-like phosphoesterase
MSQCDDPFRCVDAQLAALTASVKIVLVDMHAEATSEKLAMGRYLDGRASVVGGTHTHVQTADEQILPGGTAYITDLGMVGPHDGVIGMQTELVLERFLRGISTKFEPCDGEIKLNGLIVDVDEETGRASRVERLSLQHS